MRVPWTLWTFQMKSQFRLTQVGIRVAERFKVWNITSNTNWRKFKSWWAKKLSPNCLSTRLSPRFGPCPLFRKLLWYDKHLYRLQEQGKQRHEKLFMVMVFFYRQKEWETQARSTKRVLEGSRVNCRIKCK